MSDNGLNFEGLRKLVEAYAKRTDLRESGFLDQAIELTAVRIGRDVKMMEMERIATLNVARSAGLPDGYARMRSVATSSLPHNRSLILVSPAQFEWSYSDISVYMIANGQIHIHGEGEITISYFIRPERLVNDNDSNFVLDAAPGLYSMGTLMEVWTWAQDAEAFEMARQRYEAEVMAVNKNYSHQVFGNNASIRRVDY